MRLHVVVLKSVKQFGSMITGKSGINVNMIAGISAIGNEHNQMLVFLGVQFKEHLLNKQCSNNNNINLTIISSPYNNHLC